MSNIAVKLSIVLALPIVVFLAGTSILSRLCNQKYVLQRVRTLPDVRDQKPLYQRLNGYDSHAVNRYWGAFDDTARRYERSFLRLDLAFPVFYGTAFLTSLLLVWGMLGKPFHPGWLVVPVVITALADWAENLIQLNQLRAYIAHGAEGLQPVWIHIASTATVLKLVFFIGTALLLLGLIVGVIFHKKSS